MTFKELFGTELPIIQAPMAGVQGSALAIAVSAAGGLGSLPCAMLSPQAVGEELERIRGATGAPYNVNFFCHIPPTVDLNVEARWRRALEPYYRELGLNSQTAGPAGGREPFSAAMAAVLADFRPPVISFHFGLPDPQLLDRVRQWSPRIIASATTLAEARWLEQRGVDAIIAQGTEAGGHRGHFLSDSLEEQPARDVLLRQILEHVSIPVIAAGGIATAGDVAALLQAGAAGVQVGTSYLLCPEATTRPLHRQALRSALAGHTAVTNVFSGRPARGMVNRLVAELGPLCEFAPPFPLAANALAPLRAAAEERGSADFTPLWAGQNVTGCREIPAGQLTRELAGLA